MASAAPKPAAKPSAAPMVAKPVPRSAEPRPAGAIPDATVAILAGVKDLLPSVALAVGLCLLIFKEVPAANHDPVLAIISGMLGFLTGHATGRARAPSRPAANDNT